MFYQRKCKNFEFLVFISSELRNSFSSLPSRPSQFYLVLDVVNLTAQEMSLNYTTNKNILIESKESCRVPVPVERCPLDRLLTENTQTSDAQCKKHFTSHLVVSICNHLICSFYSADSLLSGGTDVDMTERACSEHISDQVNLKWTLTGTDTSGVTSLRGISLSATMLGLITVAPLQWGELLQFLNYSHWETFDRYNASEKSTYESYVKFPHNLPSEVTKPFTFLLIIAIIRHIRSIFCLCMSFCSEFNFPDIHSSCYFIRSIKFIQKLI